MDGGRRRHPLHLGHPLDGYLLVGHADGLAGALHDGSQVGAAEVLTAGKQFFPENLPAGDGFGGTRFAWEEDLTFPWWLAGRVGVAGARPVLHRVWRRSLGNLKWLVECSKAV